MRNRPNSNSSSPWQNRENRTVAAVAAVGAVIVAAFVALTLSGSSRETLDVEPALEPAQDTSWSLSAEAEKVARLNTGSSGPAAPQATCEYSIVPGGVHSAEDVDRAAKGDPVVGKHYSNVSVSQLTSSRTAAARDAFVSYRVGDQIYWSSGKVRLPEGEAVLTDGSTTIHARCGSLLSDGSAAPTLSREPVLSAYGSVTGSPIVGLSREGGTMNLTGGAQRVTENDRLPRRRPAALNGGGMGSVGSASAGRAAASADTRGSLGADFNSQRLSLSSGARDGGLPPAADARPSFAGPGAPFGPPGSNGGKQQGDDARNNRADVLTSDAFPADPPIPGLLSKLSDGLRTNELGIPESSEQLIDPSALTGSEGGLAQEQAPAEVVPVPEPASLVLFGSGLALAAWRIRRQSGGRKP
jgi:hypothetical protein